jgi:hypothetical protein
MKHYVRYYYTSKIDGGRFASEKFTLESQEFGLRERLGDNGFIEFVKKGEAHLESEGDFIEANLLSENEASP